VQLASFRQKRFACFAAAKPHECTEQNYKEDPLPEVEAIMLPLRLVIDVLVSAAIKPAGLQRTVFLIAISKPARLYVSHPIL